MSQTIINRNGEVLIRIGNQTGARETSYDYHDDACAFHSVYEVEDPRVLQHEKNAAYRQTTPSSILKKDVKENSFQANHVIYTKVSSAAMNHSSDTSSQIFTTRQIKTSKSQHTSQLDREYDKPSVPEVNNNNDVNAKQLLNARARDEVDNTIPPKDVCFHCRKTVYAIEKIGPIRDVLYHKNCLRCSACNFQLSLANFYQNHTNQSDRRLYCKSHQPLPEHSNVDSLVLTGAINVPKLGVYNSNVRVDAEAQKGHHIDHTSVSMRTSLTAPKLDTYNQTVRPVPQLAHAPSRISTTNPTAYLARQIPERNHHSPSPPAT